MANCLQKWSSSLLKNITVCFMMKIWKDRKKDTKKLMHASLDCSHCYNMEVIKLSIAG